MHDDPSEQYRRWLHADAEGDDEEADASLGSLFDACVPAPLPSVRFTETTMAAVGEAAVADAARAKRVRRGLVLSGLPVGALALYFGAGPVFWALSTGLVGTLNFLVAMVVWFANGHDIQSTVWTVLT